MRPSAKRRLHLVQTFAATAGALLMATVITLLPSPARAGDEALPTEDAFAKSVLAVIATYPTDGTHGYYWPKGDAWPGTTCDFDYLGTKVCEADAKKRCYCCGITFEVFVKAWKAWSDSRKVEFRVPGVSGKEMIGLRADWFGSTGDTRRTLQHAVTARKLGRAIDKLEDARPGDFVQLWRRSGTGHSVIFIELKRNSEGKPKALKYWSSQKSTNGIGYREESLEGKEGVDPEQTYVVRVGR